MRAEPVPSKKAFKKSFGVGSIRRSLPAGAMHRISKLLEFNDLSTEAQGSDGRLLILHDIDMHCSYALRHPKSSGIADKQQRLDSVKALRHSVRNELCRRMKVRHFKEATSKLDSLFGLKAQNHAAREDQVNNVKYMDVIERKEYLMHFVNGAIHRTVSSENDDQSRPYDSDRESLLVRGGQSALEFGGAPFVLSTDLKLYLTGQDINVKTGGHDFKHTTFMAGKDVLAAGTLRCEQGQLKWISAKSGHYQPTARHMLTFLEFLRAKQVNLQRVTFYRTLRNSEFNRNVHHKGEFQECNAMDFLNKRGFPGENPDSMFI